MDRFNLLLKTGAAAVGGTFSFVFGGWPALVQVLLTMVILDYVTGMLASAVEGKLLSRVGLIGIARKVFIFFIIALAHQIDIAFDSKEMIRDATTYFYMANEVLSIVENGGRLGVPVPNVIKKAIFVLKDKSGNEEGIPKKESKKDDDAQKKDEK
ncbi:toxin secretion/phage lysis holin [Paenibacillus alvei TS-15]|jgi:toxin secretion/phage lysis holin|uniref:Toxin secretion/phage lysis holin n=1 Tax=Paenibacillus alvei TS-15 TaxID=1117108 RepID=S9U0U1_PAEAL|nr:phage holin family protein [Paenibacillus alvei]EPY04155.1 toxin secretion/phage lysis holin [Paenibacillus alvei TS-15]